MHKNRTPDRPLRAFWVLLAVAILLPTARAEDIDIYGGPQAGGANSNLLIVLDNAAAASGSSAFTCPTFPSPDNAFKPKDPSANFGFEQCGLFGALVGLGDMLKAQKVATPAVTRLPLNLGLMYFPSGGTNGGQFVLPVNPGNPSNLVAMDATGIEAFKTRVAALSLSSDKSNNNQFSQALQEGFAFYNGLQGLSGNQYTALPADQLSCGKNYIVYITLATNNQKPQDGGKAAETALKTLQGKFTELTLPAYKQSFAPNATAKAKYQSDPADEWSLFMSTGTAATKQYQPVTTYTIILYDGSNPDYEQLMKNVANQSSTTPYFVKLGDTEGLKDAIGSVSRQVMAVNSVFAAPVLPVSTNSQGTYDNQVYMGLFRPDANGLPRWKGNLKQYQFGLDQTDKVNPVLFLADSTGKSALSSAGTGFLDPDAVSFWTSKNTAVLPDSKAGFWVNAMKEQGGKDGTDLPDGQVVEKGGVGQQIRLAALTDISKRNVYTCVGTGCVGNAALSGMKFISTNSNITDTLLGTDATVTKGNVIDWARGKDVALGVTSSNGAGPESSQPPDSSIIVRGSVHGDVLHSRPTVLNYKDYGTVVFYGANDGMFRAVNGNQPNNPSDTTKPRGNCLLSSTCAIGTTDASGASVQVPPGGELWSFIPTEFYGSLRRIYENNVQLTLGLAADVDHQPKPYFFDGPPSVYQKDGTAYLFIPARRGGRILYALDVSDPREPKYLWKISNDTTGFAELGQTWSQPKVAMIKGHTGPVLIFGAGYDPNQDNDPVSLADSMGRGIFVVDAKTGALLWRATVGGSDSKCTGNPCLLGEMKYSVPADITLVDRTGDGLIDRLYANDTGGNVWRVDLEPDGTGAVSTWKAYQFAALGGTGSPKRKFFFPVDVTLTKNFDAVVMVSGDREHPLRTSAANQVVNRFYMIKDSKVGLDGSAWTAVSDSTSSLLDAKPAGLFTATSAVYDGSGSGFYVTLLGTGEKGVNAPTTFGGIVYFGTNRPKTPTSTVSCTPDLGEARGYAMNFLTGERTVKLFDGGGLLPSPVTGMVTIKVDGQNLQVPFVIGGGGGVNADGKSALGVERPKISTKKNKRRTYWYRS